MSEPDNFLERWSRRKREVQREREASVEKKNAPAEAESAQQTSTDKTPADAPSSVAPAAEPAFDIASLPPIESITATTDIRDFLRPGVPAELTSAALRRAWSTDPAIRDFIGLSENSWDFNDPTAMAGFGPLDPGEAQQILARLLGGEPDAPSAPPPTQTAAADSEQVVQTASVSADEQAQASTEAQAADAAGRSQDEAPQVVAQNSAVSESANAATQQEKPGQQRAFAHPRRSHGGALPH
jgi:hypothetical protein